MLFDRIIRTELYLDEPLSDGWLLNKLLKFGFLVPYIPPYIQIRHKINPGIGVVWIPVAASELPLIQKLLRKEKLYAHPAEIRRFLSLCLMGQEETFFRSPNVPHWAEALAMELYNSEIIIEQSPPTSLPLATLLSKAPAIAIGTFIGVEAAIGSPMLMLVTVPGGIIAVGSAIGISKALERGLNRKVHELFGRKPQERKDDVASGRSEPGAKSA